MSSVKRVLYVDHTSQVSGAQGALLDLLEALPSNVIPTLMCPAGELADAARRLGLDVIEFAGTSGSLRMHPVHTPRAIADIVRSGRVVKRTAEATHADVIHANSLRAGLIVGSVRRAARAPMVLHVHDALPPTRSAAVVRRALRASADAVITISDYTTANFAGTGSREHVRMLHNPLDTARFDPAPMSRREAREALGLSQDANLIGLVAQITPWKGQEVAIRALKALRDHGTTAHLLIVGEAKFVERATRYDNIAYLRSLHELVAELGLVEQVEFLGERKDTPTIMRALDVLVAPSWEEPFGRSVIEAMALETAVVATNVGGPPEYMRDGLDGILVPPRQVEQWAAALGQLLADSARREEMGRRGSEQVRRRFDRRKYASQVVEIYDELAGGTVPPLDSAIESSGRRLRILLVEHQPLIGGAQRSLIELLRVLGRSHDVTLACPEGPLAGAVRARGMEVASIPESQLTYRLDLRQTPRELVRALRAGRAVRAIAARLRPDVIHANSLRAGLLTLGTGGDPATVVHCRDLLPSNPTATVVRRLIVRGSAARIAVSRQAALRLAGPRFAHRGTTVVDNPVDAERFDPARFSRAEVRRELGLTGSPVLGVLAQITPWKGQTRAVLTLNELRRTHPAAELVLAGEAKFVTAATRFDNPAYERDLHALVDDLGLRDAVHFIGERDDAERVMAALDVLLVPSTEEPFGRTVIEALAMRVPVAATDVGGPREVIRPGVDGVVLPPDDTTEWAASIRLLLRRGPNPESRAYAIERFSPERHASEVLRVYERIIAATPR